MNIEVSRQKYFGTQVIMFACRLDRVMVCNNMMSILQGSRWPRGQWFGCTDTLCGQIGFVARWKAGVFGHWDVPSFLCGVGICFVRTVFASVIFFFGELYITLLANVVIWTLLSSGAAIFPGIPLITNATILWRRF